LGPVFVCFKPLYIIILFSQSHKTGRLFETNQKTGRLFETNQKTGRLFENNQKKKV